MLNFIIRFFNILWKVITTVIVFSLPVAIVFIIGAFVLEFNYTFSFGFLKMFDYFYYDHLLCIILFTLQYLFQTIHSNFFITNHLKIFEFIYLLKFFPINKVFFVLIDKLIFDLFKTIVYILYN